MSLCKVYTSLSEHISARVPAALLVNALTATLTFIVFNLAINSEMVYDLPHPASPLSNANFIVRPRHICNRIIVLTHCS